MIGKSRAYCAGRPNVTTRVTDGTLEAFADGSLDLVYSFIVFQHIPIKEAIATYVREAGRTLCEGGLLRFQVDGRWRERAHREADTYDGAVFSPEEVRSLVEAAGLSVVEEWGEETHYHWVTARRGDGPGDRVRFRPRSFDAGLLASLLDTLGVEDAARKAAAVAAGELGLRAALGRFERRLDALPNREFVERVLAALLARAPEAAGVEYHTRILDGGFEDRSAMVDTVLSGAELRQLVRPHVPRVPWPRLLPFASEDGTLPGFFEAVDAAEAALSGLPPEEAVARGFALLLGHPPDAEGLAFHARPMAASPLGLRLFVREILSAPDTRPPAPPPDAEAVSRLQSRLGSGEKPPSPQAVESFPGEAAAAVRFLAETEGLEPRPFVARAYEAVLGRTADEGGLAFYAGKLEAGDLGRAAFLRELLWSDELRLPATGGSAEG